MTATLTIRNLDREDVRIIIAAFRDKRNQMLATAEKDSDNPAGQQAHRLAGIIDQTKSVYEGFPMPSVTGDYSESYA